MPAGKMAAQAGHAFLEAYLASTNASQDNYRDGDCLPSQVGTKVVLQGSYPQILKLEAKLKRLAYFGTARSGSFNNVPYAMIEDSGHVLLPHFTGEPIVTALGIGLHSEARSIIKNFHAWRIVS